MLGRFLHACSLVLALLALGFDSVRRRQVRRELESEAAADQAARRARLKEKVIDLERESAARREESATQSTEDKVEALRRRMGRSTL